MSVDYRTSITIRPREQSYSYPGFRFICYGLRKADILPTLACNEIVKRLVRRAPHCIDTGMMIVTTERRPARVVTSSFPQENSTPVTETVMNSDLQWAMK